MYPSYRSSAVVQRSVYRSEAGETHSAQVEVTHHEQLVTTHCTSERIRTSDRSIYIFCSAAESRN